jgi:LPXTG-site transpeptidase (sortase) family protein
VAALEPVVTEPIRVEIPRLAISAAVEDVGLDDEKRMDVPKQDENVAWYNLGPKPGEPGTAVVAGHYDAKTGGPAIFYELDQLKAGDIITVTTEDEKQLEFKVSRVETYQDATFPIAEVFDFSPTSKRLTLITCRGTFDKVTQNYSQRLVVYSDMI